MQSKVLRVEDVNGVEEFLCFVDRRLIWGHGEGMGTVEGLESERGGAVGGGGYEKFEGELSRCVGGMRWRKEGDGSGGGASVESELDLDVSFGGKFKSFNPCFCCSCDGRCPLSNWSIIIGSIGIIIYLPPASLYLFYSLTPPKGLKNLMASLELNRTSAPMLNIHTSHGLSRTFQVYALLSLIMILGHCSLIVAGRKMLKSASLGHPLAFLCAFVVQMLSLVICQVSEMVRGICPIWLVVNLPFEAFFSVCALGLYTQLRILPNPYANAGPNSGSEMEIGRLRTDDLNQHQHPLSTHQYSASNKIQNHPFIYQNQPPSLSLHPPSIHPLNLNPNILFQQQLRHILKSEMDRDAVPNYLPPPTLVPLPTQTHKLQKRPPPSPTTTAHPGAKGRDSSKNNGLRINCLASLGYTTRPVTTTITPMDSLGGGGGQGQGGESTTALFTGRNARRLTGGRGHKVGAYHRSNESGNQEYIPPPGYRSRTDSVLRTLVSGGGGGGGGGRGSGSVLLNVARMEDYKMIMERDPREQTDVGTTTTWSSINVEGGLGAEFGRRRRSQSLSTVDGDEEDVVVSRSSDYRRPKKEKEKGHRDRDRDRDRDQMRRKNSMR